MDDYKNISYTSKNFYAKSFKTGGTEFIKAALEGIKSDDDMAVLSVLAELSSQLSMASDTVGDDVNMQMLIKEMIGLFDKFDMIPDISSKNYHNISVLPDMSELHT
jgi:hypothetical protein